MRLSSELVITTDIAFRDLKPENILLSTTGKLKLSDFGLAGLFRYKGQERTLTERCGSLPYIAPEVMIFLL